MSNAIQWIFHQFYCQLLHRAPPRRVISVKGGATPLGVTHTHTHARTTHAHTHTYVGLVYIYGLEYKALTNLKDIPIYYPIQSLTPVYNRRRRITTTKTGPKISKQLNIKALGYDVGELVRGRHVDHPNLAQGDLLADEVCKPHYASCDSDAMDWLSNIHHSHYHNTKWSTKQWRA